MLLTLLLAARCPPALAADADYRLVGGPTFVKEKGVWRYEVESPYQRGRNPIEVLLPDRFDPKDADKKYRVLYVLPVEPGIGGRWGDGLQEVRRADAHNRHGLICVAPAFDTLPWYGSHPTDPKIRHEDYLKRVVVPLVEGRYPTVAGREGRLLVGFSKSGWGAFTLIFRDPDFFGYAAAWDAPLMLSADDFGVFETGPHFGTKENFARYLPAKLAEAARPPTSAAAPASCWPAATPSAPTPPAGSRTTRTPSRSTTTCRSSGSSTSTTTTSASATTGKRAG